MVGEDRAAGGRLHARARHASRAVSLHQRPAVWLLVVGNPDHVDLDVEPEEGAREGERRAPLAGAGLGRELLHALGLVVKGLGDRGIRLVAAGRAHALVFVENARAGSERLFESMRPVKRGRAPHAIDVAHRSRDLDMPLGRHFLTDEGHGEQRSEVGGADGLAGAGMQNRRRRRRQIGDDVVPGARNAILVHHILALRAQMSLPVGSRVSAKSGDASTGRCGR